MQPEGPFPCSHEPTTGLYILSQMNPVHSRALYFRPLGRSKEFIQGPE